MRPNKIKEMWREGKPAAAGWISTGNTYLAEAMAHAGYDAVIIDMQHGMSVTTDKAVACLQAISTTDTVPMERLPPIGQDFMLELIICNMPMKR